MFSNALDDRSMSTVDGDLESKRHLLKKLYHAAHCTHEECMTGRLCPVDPYCCASKRLLEHVLRCKDKHSEVPNSRRAKKVWKRYTKCQNIEACPLSSVVPTPYDPQKLAPRFRPHAVTGKLPRNAVYELLQASPEEDESMGPPSLVASLSSSPSHSWEESHDVNLLSEEMPPVDPNSSTPKRRTILSNTSSPTSTGIEMTLAPSPPRGEPSSSSSPSSSQLPPSAQGKENRQTRLMRKGYMLRKTTSSGGGAKVAQRQVHTAKNSHFPPKSKAPLNARISSGGARTPTPSDLPRTQRRSTDAMSVGSVSTLTAATSNSGYKPPRSPHRPLVWSQYQ